MSCNCSSTCNCNTPVAQIPPSVTVIREATPTASGCPIKGWYETLSVTSFVPQDFGETQVITVCDAYQYLPGTCIVLIDTAGNMQVQRVTGRASATSLTLTAYSNADSDESTNLSGVIYAAPLAQCPVETAAAATCQLKNLVTADAFIMPLADEDVEVTFTESVTLAVGQTIFITGAGYMQVAEPPVGDFEPCSDTFYLTNLGTGGNEASGTNVAAGAVGVLTPPPASDTSAVRGAFRRVISVGGGSQAANTDIAFDAEDVSDISAIGSFNAGGSVFTASVAGWFHFSACVQFNAGSFSPAAQEAHLIIRVNTAIKAHGNSAIDGGADDTLFVTHTVHLDVNDTVVIRWLDTGSSPATTATIEGTTSSELSAWSGFLVYAD